MLGAAGLASGALAIEGYRVLVAIIALSLVARIGNHWLGESNGVLRNGMSGV